MKTNFKLTCESDERLGLHRVSCFVDEDVSEVTGRTSGWKHSSGGHNSDHDDPSDIKMLQM